MTDRGAAASQSDQKELLSNSSEGSSAALFKRRSFSFQIMPACNKVSESSQGNLSREKRGLQRSTTDSEEKEKPVIT